MQIYIVFVVHLFWLGGYLGKRSEKLRAVEGKECIEPCYGAGLMYDVDRMYDSMTRSRSLCLNVTTWNNLKFPARRVFLSPDQVKVQVLEYIDETLNEFKKVFRAGISI